MADREVEIGDVPQSIQQNRVEFPDHGIRLLWGAAQAAGRWLLIILQQKMEDGDDDGFDVSLDRALLMESGDYEIWLAMQSDFTGDDLELPEDVEQAVEAMTAMVAAE